MENHATPLTMKKHHMLVGSATRNVVGDADTRLDREN